MSVQSFRSEPNAQTYLNDFQKQMSRIKSPFLQNIRTSTHTFHAKIKAFQQTVKAEQKSASVQIQQNRETKLVNYRQNQLETEQNTNQKQNHEPLVVNSQSEGEKVHKKYKSSQFASQFMKQWQGNNNKFSFSNIQEVKENFVNVFSKKLAVKKKQKKKKSYDFKQDQKIMLRKIFLQLQNPYESNKGFASIQKIVGFFEENQLFYLFYNIHPKRLKYVLKEFARTKGDSLTEIQFLHAFLMDRPLLKDLSDPYQKVVHRKCILENQNWLQLKKVFNTLDTFGNQTIYIKPFFQKLKTCHSNPNLIYSPVIQFPEIQRIYSLKKIIFDLEHKFEFRERVEWKDIEDIIKNFNHKQEPTFDVIFQNHLQNANIFLDSNYFLIQKKVILLLKSVFEKCPKFSEFFVNSKFVSNQILQSQDLKQFMKNPIRQKAHIYGGYINLEEVTRYIAAKAPNYIDLDEFLQYFSIKGPITNVLLQHQKLGIFQNQSSDDDSQERKMLIKIGSLERFQKYKKTKRAKKPVRQVTDFYEFHLSKKQKETIRQKKLKETLKDKQAAELKQINSKFKANPIPADLNPQRLKEQQKRMQTQKNKKLQYIAKQRQQDKQMMSYLKANTRLFEPLYKQKLQQANKNNNYQQNSEKRHKFTHKPVPWFVQENLMEKIERQKSQRKKKIYEEARLKYVRSWNKLPDFFFQDEQKDNSAQNSIIQSLKKRQYERPKVVIKANPVPDYKSLHQQFQASLQKRKQQFKPTKVEQFRLTSPKIYKQQSDSNYVSPVKFKIVSNKKWSQTLHSPPSNKISTTLKTEEWMKHNKTVQQQKKIIKEAEKIKQKQRLMKQKNFAKFMSEKLRIQEQNLPNLAAKTAEKLQKHKQTVQYLQKQTERQLCEIYARVLQRPFLFETASPKHSIGVNRKVVKNKKKSKKAVIKNIQPIDMSHQSNHYNQYYENGGDKNHFEDKEDSQSSPQPLNQGLNQSF